MKPRSPSCLIAAACLAWPAASAVAQPAGLRCETFVLHGTSAGGGIDPQISRDLSVQLTHPPFASSDTWRSLGLRARTVAAGTTFTVNYPNGHLAQVTWQPGTPATRLQIEYVHKRPDGTNARPPRRTGVSLGEWLVEAGPPYQRGVLMLALRCTR